MKNLVLEFVKGVTLNLTDDNSVYRIVKCGDDVFTLKDYRCQFGHDDSLPYHAILCCNGKEMCECFNDGWGGETIITPSDATLFDEVCDRFIDNYKWSFVGYEHNLTLSFIADTLACGEDEACKNKKQAKEEVTLEDKYSLWKVFLKGEDDFTYVQTKPTTISKAYKVIAKALDVSVGDIIGFIGQ